MKQREYQARGIQRGPLQTHHNKNGKIPRQREDLKGSKEETRSNTQGTPIRLAADFSMETFQARREWQNILQVMTTRGLQPRLLYPARLSSNTKGQIKSFPDKRSLKEYTSTKPALQDMLKGLL